MYSLQDNVGDNNGDFIINRISDAVEMVRIYYGGTMAKWAGLPPAQNVTTYGNFALITLP